MILVTGGSGFIGSNLVAALAARGRHDVVVCDRLGRDDKWRNLGSQELARFVDAEDLRGFLEHNFADIEIIFHLGAISSTTTRDARRVVRTNFELPVWLWELCARHRLRLIWASSAATYGDGSRGFDDDFRPEALARLEPQSLYAWSKHLFDRYCARQLAAGAARPAQLAGLKFFNVYGPHEAHKGSQRSMVSQAVAVIRDTGQVRLFRSDDPALEHGGHRRDFVSVHDCVSVMLWLLDNPEVCGLFNVGTGTARSFNELARAVFVAMGVRPRIEYIDMPSHLCGQYQSFTEARIDRLRASGYLQPFQTLEAGVHAYVQDLLGLGRTREH